MGSRNEGSSRGGYLPGRIQLTELTDEGVAMLKACEEEVTRLEELIFGSLGEEGEERLRELLQAAIDFDSTED